MLQLRLAQPEDCRLVWQWSNDPVVRAASFSPELIPWEQHTVWFDRKVNAPTSVFYIVMDEAMEPMGQVRFELEGDEATISVSLGSRHRGKGYGSAAIQLASAALFEEAEVHVVHAYIKQENQASIRAFEKAGFEFYQDTTIAGAASTHLRLEKK